MKITTIPTTVVLGLAASGLLATASNFVHVVPLTRCNDWTGARLFSAQVTIQAQTLQLQVMNAARVTWVNPRCSTDGYFADLCGTSVYHGPGPTGDDNLVVVDGGGEVYLRAGSVTFEARKDVMQLGSMYFTCICL
jgi:hypothetical protein